MFLTKNEALAIFTALASHSKIIGTTGENVVARVQKEIWLTEINSYINKKYLILY